MLCQACHKNEATVHLTEIKDGQVVSVHLCEQCAREKGLQVTPPFSMSDFLSGLTELNLAPEEETARCPQCGLSLAEFRSAGRLGCGRCYRVFQRSLLPLIKTLQKGESHQGKVPSTHPVRPGPEELKKALQKALGREEYEEAARLRDQIKRLEKPR